MEEKERGLRFKGVGAEVFRRERREMGRVPCGLRGYAGMDLNSMGGKKERYRMGGWKRRKGDEV